MRIEQVRPRAKAGVQLDDAGFAQRVDGRIRHLCEALPQVVVDGAGRAGERGDRRVVAHGPNGVFAIDRHRLQHHADVFACVAKEPLQFEQARGWQAALPSVGIGKRKIVDQRLVFHFTIEAGEDLARVQDLIALQVDDQHLAGTETAAFENRFRIEIDQTGLRAGDHQAIASDEVAAGPQTVAVERCANEMTIGEGECGRPVPRFDAVGMVVHELGDLLEPRRGDQHADGLAHATAIAGEQLHGFVEAGGVRAIQRVERVVLGGNGRGACVHARAIAPDSIDLAIVREHAQRLRAAPCRLGVGGVALMEDGKRGLICRIGEIGIELRQQAAGAQRFVHNGGVRERADVDGSLLPLELFARQKEAALQVGGMRGDERLQDARCGCQRLLAQVLRADGHFAPGQQPAAVLLQCLFEAPLRRSGINGRREEADAHGESAVLLQRESGGTQQEIARELRHDADPVAAFPIGGYGTAMRKAAEGGERMGQHLVRRRIRHTRNEADTARVVVEARVK